MDRLAVFLDYENVHRTGHQLFSAKGLNTYETVVNPILIAERLVRKRIRPSELVSINIFRGKPVPEHQPTAASANDKHAQIWTVDSRVRLTRRDLKYEFDSEGKWIKSREKGIDVALAVGLVAGAIKNEFDAAIVFSSDTDLLPAVEVAFKDTKAWIEIACWSSANPLWFREGLVLTPQKFEPFCHFLNETDFEQCRQQ
jgi:uncharacterized LabA/DUF88 family protein